ETKEEVKAGKERSDIVAVPAASVVGEAMLAIVLTDAFLEKFGGDFIEEIKERFERYKQYVKNF
ncbi:MAG: chorismate synthase, partial [Aquificaceae bacterium]|nr:chorismate synthase [Aquificaceae bacterium]